MASFPNRAQVPKERRAAKIVEFAQLHVELLCLHTFIEHCYSFKKFPRFRLAKSTRLIDHNQLLMTKFGRILCLARIEKWRTFHSFQD